MVARRARLHDARLVRDFSLAGVIASVAMIGAIALYSVPRAESALAYESLTHQTLRQWRQVLASQIPTSQRAIVFVRYSPTHQVHESLITNDPDLARARLWIVYDRGAENARLAALAPDRQTYLYDENTHSLTALATALARR
jgi:hypothetical protein